MRPTLRQATSSWNRPADRVTIDHGTAWVAQTRSQQRDRRRSAGVTLSTSFASIGTTTQDLVRFLLARLDEDGTEIKRLARDRTDEVDGIRSIERLRADLTAKRRLIGTLQQLIVLRDQPFERAIRHQAAEMLRFLALPYDRHEAYRPEWRPAGSH